MIGLTGRSKVPDLAIFSSNSQKSLDLFIAEDDETRGFFMTGKNLVAGKNVSGACSDRNEFSSCPLPTPPTFS